VTDKLTWDSPEVRALQQRQDREGIADLIRQGRLALSARNPYRHQIPVEVSPDSSAADDPPDGKGEPLTVAEFADLRRRGAVRELREAAAHGRIPWSPRNPYAPRPAPATTTEGD